MNHIDKLARVIILALMSFAITNSVSAAQTGIFSDPSSGVENTFQSLIHKVHSTTVNEDGSRTTRHCKSKTECRYCTKKCLAPAKCIAKDCCTEWSKSVCRTGPPPKDAAPTSLN